MVIAAQQGFYEAAAQVIPVFILVVAIGETRTLRIDSRPISPWPVQLLLTTLMLGVMLIGEVAALKALIDGRDTGLIQAMTQGALVYGVTLLFFGFTDVLLADRKLSTGRMEGARRLQLVLTLAVLVVSVLLLYA